MKQFLIINIFRNYFCFFAFLWATLLLAPKEAKEQNINMEKIYTKEVSRSLANQRSIYHSNDRHFFLFFNCALFYPGCQLRVQNKTTNANDTFSVLWIFIGNRLSLWKPKYKNLPGQTWGALKDSLESCGYQLPSRRILRSLPSLFFQPTPWFWDWHGGLVCLGKAVRWEALHEALSSNDSTTSPSDHNQWYSMW